MALIKRMREPRSIDQMRREMEQFFEDMVPFSWSGDNGGGGMKMWSPNADVSEDDKEYVVQMDLPGMEKENIDVSLQENRLTITGERKEEEKEEKKNFLRQERYSGSFYRSFILSDNVREEDIKANFKDGVLRIRIPKTEEKKPKTVMIE